MAKRIAIAAACVGVALAGCGSKGVDENEVRSVIQQFAAADGPEACSLLSPKGLVNVYGGYKKPVPVARRECLRRSSRFKGERVRITNLDVTDDDHVTAGAKNPSGTISYTIRMVRVGGNWRIEKINQAKVQE